MTCRMDIWPLLMDGRVYYETSRVDKFVCTTNAIPILVDMYHIRYREEPKVYAVWINPERVRVYGVYTDKQMLRSVHALH
jgi:hypothetical protein